MVETLLLLSILLVLVAAVYQLFVVNDTIFRSLTVAHQRLFQRAFAANCYFNVEACTYSGDLRAKVSWDFDEIPEIAVPFIGVFRQAGAATLHISSNSPNSPDGFKRTTLGVGTYLGRFQALNWAYTQTCGCTADEAYWDAYLNDLLAEGDGGMFGGGRGRP